VAVCGYHGWQDWFIGSTSRKKGVPDSVSKLTHSFQFNQIETLRDLMTQFEGNIAAIIMEPMNSQYPNPGFLEEIRNIATKNGSVLIFDETITGFRFSKGGAQELFGIEPDLSTFGKGIANGFPLSAVVGRRELMMEMEQIFFSGTFGGELLSLAAAKYVLDRVASENIPMQLVPDSST
jgi:glutamate-1-semialdehyde 2,1-aminomutase